MYFTIDTQVSRADAKLHRETIADLSAKLHEAQSEASASLAALTALKFRAECFDTLSLELSESRAAVTAVEHQAAMFAAAENRCAAALLETQRDLIAVRSEVLEKTATMAFLVRANILHLFFRTQTLTADS